VVVDPVTLGAVLAAVVGGAGGALGAQVWAGVSALVRRPFHRPHIPAGAADTQPRSGEAELVALAQAPGDQARGIILAEVLLGRAGADEEFRLALPEWWEQASQFQVSGSTANSISGGTFHGPRLQGGDFTGLTFGSTASSAPQSAGTPFCIGQSDI
jgi:hypothetical protein